MTPIPEGFSPLETVSPFIHNNGPFYCKTLEQEQVFGLQVQQKHCNRGNRLHGGMVCTIADIAIGHNIGLLLWAKGEQQKLESTPPEQTTSVPPTSGPPGAPNASPGLALSLKFCGFKLFQTLAR